MYSMVVANQHLTRRLPQHINGSSTIILEFEKSQMEREGFLRFLTHTMI